MKKGKGKFRIIATLTFSAVMLIYISFNCLFTDFGTKAISGISVPATLKNLVDTVSDDSSSGSNLSEISAKENNKQSGSVESSKTSTSSKTVASSEAAKGKIIDRTISPYSAPTGYSNVFIKNSTGLNVDIKSLLNANLKYKIKSNSEPQVLIMHTHTTESYMTENRDFYTDSDKSRRTDESLNMVSIGNIISDKLNSAGIKTLHDKTMHDYPNYNGSYSRAASTINGYLKKYPSLKIVIDVHRDAMSTGNDKIKVTTDIEGKKAAQVMIVMGSQSGSVTNFPEWQENLKLALKLQQTLEVMYPTLARPLSLVSSNYNESLTNGSMLFEMGTDANTIEEVKYSAELMGNALVSLLNRLK